MADDFIIEEEEEAGGNRPFLIAAGALLTVFILAAACTGILLFNRNGSNANAEAIAIRETENAITLATNAPVTQTVAAMETEAAQPTNTPVPTATNTIVPTNTPQPTNTPVVAQAGDNGDGTSGEGDAAATPNLSGTSVFEATSEAGAAGSDAGDGEGSGDASSTATPIPAETTADSTGTSDDALPQTGIETWTWFLAALVLIGILVGARRLRVS